MKYTLLENFLFPTTYLNSHKLRSELQGKTILITGASSGIGKQLAYTLSELDVHLILVARRQEELQLIKDEIELLAAKVTIFPADLRVQEEMEELLSVIHRLPEGLDFVVNNAGISINRSIKNSLNRYHDFTRTMAINYFAPVQLLLSLIPLLQQKNGQIINISTINVFLPPFRNWAAYQASKSAFDTWFRSASSELNEMGISTTSLYLPLVRTPMILPTEAYRKMPAMSANHVANIICKSMYTKRRTIKPWWLIFGQLTSVIFSRFKLVSLRNRRR